MEKINIVDGKPSERILSLSEFKTDLYNGSFYGLMHCEIKIGGVSTFNKYILSSMEDESGNNVFIITNIDTKTGIISMPIDEKDMLDTNIYEVYRFDNISTLFKWLSEKYE